MDKINLLPEELQPGLDIDIRKLVLNGVIILALLGMLSAYGIFLYRFYITKNELVQAYAELTRLRPKVAEVETIKQQRLNIESKVKVLRGLVEEQQTWSAMLDDLNVIIPIDAWLTGITIYYEPDFDPSAAKKENGDENTKGKNVQKKANTKDSVTQQGMHTPNAVTLEGKSRSVASVGVFVHNLNQLPHFTRVRLNGVYENFSEGTVTFSITAAVAAATVAAPGDVAPDNYAAEQKYSMQDKATNLGGGR